MQGSLLRTNLSANSFFSTGNSLFHQWSSRFRTNIKSLFFSNLLFNSFYYVWMKLQVAPQLPLSILFVYHLRRQKCKLNFRNTPPPPKTFVSMKFIVFGFQAFSILNFLPTVVLSLRFSIKCHRPQVTINQNTTYASSASSLLWLQIKLFQELRGQYPNSATASDKCKNGN